MDNFLIFINVCYQTLWFRRYFRIYTFEINKTKSYEYCVFNSLPSESVEAIGQRDIGCRLIRGELSFSWQQRWQVHHLDVRAVLNSIGVRPPTMQREQILKKQWKYWRITTLTTICLICVFLETGSDRHTQNMYFIVYQSSISSRQPLDLTNFKLKGGFKGAVLISVW